ncbi:hypothetical protein BA20089_00025 [Bifidobacterium asteroides DSM 20089]|uniref:YhgE/Pip domain protein n=1 Tax=Bifidobacterium asteroides DSM 20089 TaxID=1437594 RepID=A0AAD0A9P7_9BIFI|nr:hypothetical protein [Bifidobacterium asteroides]ATO40751.1 hypothetical protein BA20089_00025 [Bifidobacterium asteroides DSM 20089]
MNNVMAIVRRDIVRLLRVPAAWVVLFGIIFIPPLYAWFNIAGFWNPYGNTSSIEVIVANNDRGTDSQTIGKMNMGRSDRQTAQRQQPAGLEIRRQVRGHAARGIREKLRCHRHPQELQ